MRSTFAVRETASNGGTSGAPLKPLRVDSALRALSSPRGLRGAPEVPPLCRETQSLGQQMLNAPVGINGLTYVYIETSLYGTNWNVRCTYYTADYISIAISLTYVCIQSRRIINFSKRVLNMITVSFTCICIMYMHIQWEKRKWLTARKQYLFKQACFWGVSHFFFLGRRLIFQNEFWLWFRSVLKPEWHF